MPHCWLWMHYIRVFRSTSSEQQLQIDDIFRALDTSYLTSEGFSSASSSRSMYVNHNIEGAERSNAFRQTVWIEWLERPPNGVVRTAISLSKVFLIVRIPPPHTHSSNATQTDNPFIHTRWNRSKWLSSPLQVCWRTTVFPACIPIQFVWQWIGIDQSVPTTRYDLVSI